MQATNERGVLLVKEALKSVDLDSSTHSPMENSLGMTLFCYTHGMKLVVAGFAGALLGFLGSRVIFVGSALSLLPWGIIGILLGLVVKDKKEAIFNGAVYGFFLSFIFMISGYTGTRPLISVTPFFILLGLFGALCGAVLGIMGFFLKKIFRK